MTDPEKIAKDVLENLERAKSKIVVAGMQLKNGGLSDAVTIGILREVVRGLDAARAALQLEVSNRARAEFAARALPTSDR